MHKQIAVGGIRICGLIICYVIVAFRKMRVVISKQERIYYI